MHAQGENFYKVSSDLFSIKNRAISFYPISFKVLQIFYAYVMLLLSFQCEIKTAEKLDTLDATNEIDFPIFGSNLSYTLRPFLAIKTINIALFDAFNLLLVQGNKIRLVEFK